MSEFKKGDRVEIKYPFKVGSLPNVGKRATVLGFSRTPECIRISIDGYKIPQTYHESFLEKI